MKNTVLIKDEVVDLSLDVSRNKTYRRSEAAVFYRTRDKWGEFSNMAAHFPVFVNGVHFKTAEALYQACRFPHLPEVQKEIVSDPSPKGAKMVAKRCRAKSRLDFDEIKVPLMWWVLRAKLACNQLPFSTALKNSGDLPIVEKTETDQFWGVTKSEDATTLTGKNVLGRLLILLRQTVATKGVEVVVDVKPPVIDGLLLYGKPILTVNDAPGKRWFT